ncbi:hypothetical protein [Nodosilinea nodulosa]|uniref:hypothetical protein n=1 Tax=Nodosilinea nodulosa TaxID=416001 RepID=UPI0012D82DC8|nr:hypothetical protein [Nodosilinea nodulosa]
MNNLHHSPKIATAKLEFLAKANVNNPNGFSYRTDESVAPAPPMGFPANPSLTPPIASTTMAIGVIIALTYFVKALGELIHPPR